MCSETSNSIRINQLNIGFKGFSLSEIALYSNDSSCVIEFGFY